MAFPNPATEEYLRTTFTGNAEAESVQDYLNRMHPRNAIVHAMLEQRITDAAIPNVLMDDDPIDRTSLAHTNVAALSRAEGAATVYETPVAPNRLFNRHQTFTFGVAASRESQRIRYYGIEDPMERGIERALVKAMDSNEIAMHFGIGSNASPTRMHGLIAQCAPTGIERRHGVGSPASVGNWLQNVPAKFWTSMFNAQGTPLSRDLLYDQVWGPGWQIGHQTEGSITLCGDRMMKLFADFPAPAGRMPLNEREINARDQRIDDIITVIRTPAYGEMYIAPDRFLSIPGITLDFHNNDTQAGLGLTNGTVTLLSLNGSIAPDKTILTLMPGELSILAIDNIGYKMLASDGDYSAGIIFSQKTLQNEHLFSIIGGANLNT